MPFGLRLKKSSRDPAAAAAAARAEEYRRYSERDEARRVAEQRASVAAARDKYRQSEAQRARTGNFLSMDVADSSYGNQLDKLPLFGINWKKLFKRQSRGRQSGAEGRRSRRRYKSSRRVFRKKTRATRRRR